MFNLRHRNTFTQAFMIGLEQFIKDIFEKPAFGVCSWWGGKLGIQSDNIRLFFIYTSCLTIGSPLIIYLVMALMLKHKSFFKPSSIKRPSVWDL